MAEECAGLARRAEGEADLWLVLACRAGAAGVTAAKHVIADEAAGAASLLMGQGDEGLPIVIIRGLDWAAGTGNAADLVRPPKLDLFR